jgi:hypothetical protein
MQHPAQPPAPGLATFDGSQTVMPGQQQATPQPDQHDKAVLEKITKRKKKTIAAYGHLKRIKPLDEQADQREKSPQNTATPSVTPPVSPAILELANNDDLNVATIARQAEKAQKKQPPDDEVVISLR